MKSQIPSTKLQTNFKLQYSMTKTQSRFGILKLGTHPQGGESKRSADNFGHCYLFDICDLEFQFLCTLTWLRAPDFP
jgi:hypothetical protein